VLTPDEEVAYQRQMQRVHMGRGWIDIGQHYTVMRSGRIYQGRPDNVVGSHCPGRNADSIGIETQGTFLGDSVPSPEQTEALQQLVRWLCVRYGLEPAKAVTYHRAWYPTQCPGRLVEFIPAIIAGETKTAQSESTEEEDEVARRTFAIRPGEAATYHVWLGRPTWLHLWRTDGGSQPVKVHVALYRWGARLYDPANVIWAQWVQVSSDMTIGLHTIARDIEAKLNVWVPDDQPAGVTGDVEE
jgi:hypothetical protein